MPDQLISDLSRLRSRWSRYENRIAKLEQEADDAMDNEAPAIVEKVQEVRARLAETKLALAAEERRLLDPNAKLRFSGPKRKGKPKKVKANAA